MWAAVSLGFIALSAALWIAAVYFGAAAQFGGHILSTVISCALLLAPYWAFGFGAAEWCRRRTSIFLPLLLIVPYLIFAIPRGLFRWDMCLGLSAIVLSIGLLIDHPWIILAILGISVDLHFFDKAWPLAGLSSMPKLLFLDAALYGFLVLRPLEGIGYDFRVRWTDLKTGLREFAFYTPLAVALGFALGFLHMHRILATPLWFGSA